MVTLLTIYGVGVIAAFGYVMLMTAAHAPMIDRPAVLTISCAILAVLWPALAIRSFLWTYSEGVTSRHQSQARGVN